MAQLRRPQPPDGPTGQALDRVLDLNNNCLRGTAGGELRFLPSDGESGLWHLVGTRPDERPLDGRVDPIELVAWLNMHGGPIEDPAITYDVTVGLFDEFPPGEDGRIVTGDM